MGFFKVYHRHPSPPPHFARSTHRLILTAEEWWEVISRIRGETGNLKAIGTAVIKSATAGTTVKAICTSEVTEIYVLLAVRKHVFFF